MSTALLEAADLDAAARQLERLGLTDGLPVIVPTPQRVERMVIASGLPADYLLGVMEPAKGAATVEKVAVAAVMAGCDPDAFPVVVAAVQAVCDPTMSLDSIQATTHNIAPLIIVNGPARHACGPFNSAAGVLGPGFRANATVGRALRLALLNIGGGTPGTVDLSAIGQPAKFSYCMAENEEESPFPGLHTTRGFAADESAVTVVCVEGPHSYAGACPGVGELPADGLLTLVSRAIATPAANSAHLDGDNPGVVVFNPLHARRLAEAGHTRETVRRVIVERAGNTLAELRSYYGDDAFVGPGDEFHPVFRDPDLLLIVVAGGPSVYGAVMPTIGFSMGRPVSRRIELDQACAYIPPSPDA